MTAALFAVIQALILLNSLRQLHTVNAIALLRARTWASAAPRQVGADAGGRGAAGRCVLAGGVHQEPLAALLWFFAAVIMVILATYLLFISGSVTLCRGLQSNKNYYYDPRHFVSVSSMAYRMKRNGAGLASVCILATMVLVMISSTTCLYFGQEDAVNARYPRDLAVTVYGDRYLLDRERWHRLRQGVESTIFNFGGKVSNVAEYRDDQPQRTAGRRGPDRYRQLRRTLGQHPCRPDTLPAAGGTTMPPRGRRCPSVTGRCMWPHCGWTLTAIRCPLTAA